MVCMYIYLGKDLCVKKKIGCKLFFKKSYIYLNIILLIKFDFYFKLKFCLMYYDIYWIFQVMDGYFVYFLVLEGLDLMLMDIVFVLD